MRRNAQTRAEFADALGVLAEQIDHLRARFGNPSVLFLSRIGQVCLPYGLYKADTQTDYSDKSAYPVLRHDYFRPSFVAAPALYGQDGQRIRMTFPSTRYSGVFNWAKLYVPPAPLAPSVTLATVGRSSVSGNTHAFALAEARRHPARPTAELAESVAVVLSEPDSNFQWTYDVPGGNGNLRYTAEIPRICLPGSSMGRIAVSGGARA